MQGRTIATEKVMSLVAQGMESWQEAWTLVLGRFFDSEISYTPAGEQNLKPEAWSVEKQRVKFNNRGVLSVSGFS